MKNSKTNGRIALRILGLCMLMVWSFSDVVAQIEMKESDHRIMKRKCEETVDKYYAVLNLIGNSQSSFEEKEIYIENLMINTIYSNDVKINNDLSEDGVDAFAARDYFNTVLSYFSSGRGVEYTYDINDVLGPYRSSDDFVFYIVQLKRHLSGENTTGVVIDNDEALDVYLRFEKIDENWSYHPTIYDVRSKSEDAETIFGEVKIYSSSNSTNTIAEHIESDKWEIVKTQDFVEGTVPQRIISAPWPAHRAHENRRLAFYLGQKRNFYYDFAGDKRNVSRFFNDNSPESSKIYVFNPLGALSTNVTSGDKHSFIPDFGFKSTIKPKGVEKVLVAYQNYPTHFTGFAANRHDPVGQVIGNLWYREPVNSMKGEFEYNYLEYDESGGKPGSVNLKLEYADSNPRMDHDRYMINEIYVARCGDGVVDNVNRSRDEHEDGAEGIFLPNDGTLIEWRDPDPEIINEHCDDGNLNSDTRRGACKTDCSGRVQ